MDLKIRLISVIKIEKLINANLDRFGHLLKYSGNEECEILYYSSISWLMKVVFESNKNRYLITIDEGIVSIIDRNDPERYECVFDIAFDKDDIETFVGALETIVVMFLELNVEG